MQHYWSHHKQHPTLLVDFTNYRSTQLSSHLLHSSSQVTGALVSCSARIQSPSHILPSEAHVDIDVID
jgi:hypothetical protein